jgi:hypothetical protein
MNSKWVLIEFFSTKVFLTCTMQINDCVGSHGDFAVCKFKHDLFHADRVEK